MVRLARANERVFLKLFALVFLALVTAPAAHGCRTRPAADGCELLRCARVGAAWPLADGCEKVAPNDLRFGDRWVLCQPLVVTHWVRRARTCCDSAIGSAPLEAAALWFACASCRRLFREA